ncbi:head-tail connector protein [Nisaea nitritireducens]|uniref:head-tail connector protein n=1 Tax=Nisaea nitritireducens TaxID=568392 RepID=UPI001865BCDD|nr:head-tail connector protein [Nisaea nitritireducens]
MALVRTEEPSGDVVAATDLYAHLRVDLIGGATAPDDANDIAALQDSAVGYLDGASGILNRALLTQKWELRLDRFGPCIEIPLPPLQSVDEIRYIDTAGAEQTLPPVDYRVIENGEMPAEVVPAYGASWPSVLSTLQAVTVVFTCGYGDAADIPAPIKQAIKLMVGEWYSKREATVGQPVNELPLGVGALLASFRVG